jgi:hypothetical protein
MSAIPKVDMLTMRVVQLCHELRTSPQQGIRTSRQPGHGSIGRSRNDAGRCGAGTCSSTWCLGASGMALCSRGSRTVPTVGRSGAEGGVYGQGAAKCGGTSSGRRRCSRSDTEHCGDQGIGGAPMAPQGRRTRRCRKELSWSLSMTVSVTDADLRLIVSSFPRQSEGSRACRKE